MDAESVWTWVLFGFELMGDHWDVVHWPQTLVGIGNRALPIYSVIYDKPGFIAMSFMWWSMNFFNMVKWRKEERSTAADPSDFGSQSR